MAIGSWDDLGGYTLEEEFARGGFGEIWRGTCHAKGTHGERTATGVSQEHLVLKRISLQKGLEVRIMPYQVIDITSISAVVKNNPDHFRYNLLYHRRCASINIWGRP